MVQAIPDSSLKDPFLRNPTAANLAQKNEILVTSSVGTDKTAHMRKEKERKEKDVVGQAHPEVDSGRKELDKGIVA